MKTGSAPRHCTLYGEESLRIMSSVRQASSSSSWRSAASRSIAKGHSYGYETNGMRSCRRTAPGSTRAAVIAAPSSGSRAGLRLLVAAADAQHLEEPAPENLQANGDGGHASEDDLKEHAARAGIDIRKHRPATLTNRRRTRRHPRQEDQAARSRHRPEEEHRSVAVRIRREAEQERDAQERHVDECNHGGDGGASLDGRRTGHREQRHGGIGERLPT